MISPQLLAEKIRVHYSGRKDIPLHEPCFTGNERRYVLDAIDSTFVSSVGEYVTRFEKTLAAMSGSAAAVAVVNGTAALHLALLGAGVGPGDEVLTQSLTFVATANAIRYCGAEPVFVDVDIDTAGMSPTALERYLIENAERSGSCIRNRHTGRKIAACVPMHTFGLVARIGEIAALCRKWNIPLVEDAAESLGSRSGEHWTGTFGLCGVFSFNGNKTITCGGGGAIVTNDAGLAARLKHLSTTAKEPHRYEFVHDQLGYNYRMPNLNAALACAQLEQLDHFIRDKRETAAFYHGIFEDESFGMMRERPGTYSNYWLNALLLPDQAERDFYLNELLRQGITVRPVWRPMHQLPMFHAGPHVGLKVTEDLAGRIISLPSSVRKE